MMLSQRLLEEILIMFKGAFSHPSGMSNCSKYSSLLTLSNKTYVMHSLQKSCFFE